MSITGMKERDGPWYLTEHFIEREKDELDKICRSDWADWDQSGDLLFAMDGCRYRVSCDGGELTSPFRACCKDRGFLKANG